MACKSCSGGKQKMGVCRVHELVNNNTTERLVKYCAICKAWICNQCEKNPIKRAAAAALDLTNKFRA